MPTNIFNSFHIISHIFVSEGRILIKVIPAVRSPLYSRLLNSIWPPINPKHIPPVGEGRSNEYGGNCGGKMWKIIQVEIAVKKWLKSGTRLDSGKNVPTFKLFFLLKNLVEREPEAWSWFSPEGIMLQYPHLLYSQGLYL